MGLLWDVLFPRPARRPAIEVTAEDLRLREQLAEAQARVVELERQLPRFTADQLNATIQNVADELFLEGILTQEIEWVTEPAQELARLIGVEPATVAAGFTAEQANAVISAVLEEFGRRDWLTDSFEGWEPETYEELLGRLAPQVATPGELTDEQRGVLGKIWGSGIVGLFRELLEAAGIDPMPDWSECRRIVRELRLQPTLDRAAIGRVFQPVIAQILAEQARRAGAPAPPDSTPPPATPAARRPPVVVKPKPAAAASADEEF